MVSIGSQFVGPFWPRGLKIDDVNFSPEEVIETFKEMITEARDQKISDVVTERSSSCIPVLEGIFDRGNISAVMRSAEAFGFHNFHIIEKNEEFKESSRVSQGADKWLNVKKWTSTTKALENLKEQGVKIYATHLSKSSCEIKDLNFTRPIALIFGNEKDGVSDEALSFCDGNVLIPMYGFTQSFNISVAAALCFQEASKKSKPVSEEEQLALKAKYYLRSLDLSEQQIRKILQG